MQEVIVENPPATFADKSAANRVARAAFVLSVLVGAFLLFMVEPLIGKIVTPKFGGISAVWSMCMLFFQTTLLIGYAITYLLSKLRPRVQAIVYIALLLASLPLIEIPAPVAWDPGFDDVRERIPDADTHGVRLGPHCEGSRTRLACEGGRDQRARDQQPHAVRRRRARRKCLATRS